MVDETGFPRGKGSGTVPPSVPSACPARLPHGLPPAQKGLAGPQEPWGHALALPSRWDAQGQPSWTPASAGSLGSILQSSVGLGRNSQAAPLNFSSSVNHLQNRGGDYCKGRFSVWGELRESELLSGSPGNLAAGGSGTPP